MFIEDMSQEECIEVVSRSRLARLGCAIDNQPYIVPVYLVYRETPPGQSFLYGFTTPGQKIEWMRVNPLVCAEFEEVTSHDQWRSVVIFGLYDELPDTPDREQDRLQAHHLLREFVGWWETGFAAHSARVQREGPQRLRPLYYRIRIDQFTGRRAQPGRPAAPL